MRQAYGLAKHLVVLPADARPGRGVAEVACDEVYVRRSRERLELLVAAPAREVVEERDGVVAVRGEPVREVVSDEARAARDQNAAPTHSVR